MAEPFSLSPTPLPFPKKSSPFEDFLKQQNMLRDMVLTQLQLRLDPREWDEITKMVRRMPVQQGLQFLLPFIEGHLRTPREAEKLMERVPGKEMASFEQRLAPSFESKLQELFRYGKLRNILSTLPRPMSIKN